MSMYMVQVSYTADAMAALIANPVDRTKHVAGVIKKLGGKMTNFWFTLGDYDLVGLLDMPDNVSAAAFALSLGAGGAIEAIKTTPLLTIAEGIEAMKKAGTSGYKPVGS